MPVSSVMHLFKYSFNLIISIVLSHKLKQGCSQQNHDYRKILSNLQITQVWTISKARRRSRYSSPPRMQRSA